MSESKFSDEEIEKERRAQTKRRAYADRETLQAKKDFLAAARHDTQEEFQARLSRRGIQSGSETWNKAMEAYWAIRRAR
jgi:hypothetical protein